MATSSKSHYRLPLLGSGGPLPTVHYLEGSILIDGLGAGNSIHAMAVNQTGSHVVAGTKQGTLYFFEYSSENGYVRTATMEHDAPILAAHFINDIECVVADTRSRILAISMPAASPLMISVPNPVCAFVSSGDLLAGLTIDGQVLLWANSIRERISQTLSAAAPAPPYAWTQGAYWEDASCILFPSENGGVTCVDTESLAVRTIFEHTGRLYAIAEADSYVMTVGHDDNRARLWAGNPLGTFAELTAPPGIVGVLLTGIIESPFLLLNSAGQAFRCAIARDRLVSQGTEVVNDLRCGVGVSPSTYRAMLRHAHENRLNQTIDCIQDLLSSKDCGDIGNHIAVLRDLQREDLALAFEAEAAAITNNLFEELQKRSQLWALLPYTPQLLPSRLRLIHLLVTLFRFHDALDKLEELSADCSDAEIGLPEHQLERLADLVSDGTCVAQPPAVEGIAPIIEAWTHLPEPWRTRVLIRTGKDIACGNAPLSIDRLANRINTLLAATRDADLFRIETAHLTVVSGWEADEEDAYLLIGSQEHEYSPLELALTIKVEANHTTARTFLLFNPQHLPQEKEITKHNRLCMEYMEALVRKSYGRYWIEHASKFATHALECLVSEEKAAMRRGDFV